MARSCVTGYTITPEMGGRYRVDEVRSEPTSMPKYSIHSSYSEAESAVKKYMKELDRRRDEERKTKEFREKNPIKFFSVANSTD